MGEDLKSHARVEDMREEFAAYAHIPEAREIIQTTKIMDELAGFRCRAAWLGLHNLRKYFGVEGADFDGLVNSAEAAITARESESSKSCDDPSPLSSAVDR